jgi:hypothetical protein
MQQGSAMNQPKPADQPGPDVCSRCLRPVHLATGTDHGQPWQSWTHDHVADDVFCGLVMRAPERVEQARKAAQ